jgi:hypothetical protein
MPRLLKESEAWREIAELEAASEPDYRFLCFTAETLLRNQQIATETLTAMRRRVLDNIALDDSNNGYRDAIDTDPQEHNPVRVLAALFLSYEAEDEGK